MRQFIFTISLFANLVALGQEVDVINEIKKDFNNYFNLISERKIDSALLYSNPKLFELFPKEQMKNFMEVVYNMPNIEYKTGTPIFIKFDELKRIENVDYVRFYIISPAEMKFKDIKNTKKTVSQMIKNFEMKFGVGNVEFDNQTGFYKINAEKTIIASSNNNHVDWKFVTVDNPKMKILLKKILPSELVN